MSSIVTLEAVPNQSLSIDLENVRYDLRFRDLGSMMALDLSINDESILAGSRVVGGTPLIPYRYLEGDGGNFLFSTELGDLPYYEQFGITQFLIYFTVAELEAIRSAN